MRDNKELRKKIEKMSQEAKHGGESEELRIAIYEAAKAALENVQDMLKPMSDAEIIFIIPAMKVIVKNLDCVLNENDKAFTENIYPIMRMMFDAAEKE